jgi:hypothetical protein
MDIFFHDPEDIPLPPEEVRIRDFRAQPYPDGRRIRIYLEVTPFQQRPSGEITIFNPAGEPAASASIIETITKQMEMTMHLRGTAMAGTHTIVAEIFYEDPPPEPDTDESIDLSNYTNPPKMFVDKMEIQFEIPEG